MPEKQWKRAINHFLPNDIYIIDSFLVDENFHSRYSAIKKEYHYMLSMNDYSPFETNYIYQYGKELDIEAMRNAAKIFIGEITILHPFVLLINMAIQLEHFIKLKLKIIKVLLLLSL